MFFEQLSDGTEDELSRLREVAPKVKSYGPNRSSAPCTSEWLGF
jgi:hypothetical protein